MSGTQSKTTQTELEKRLQELVEAQKELIEWLESGATSGDAEIRRRIEEATR